MAPFDDTLHMVPCSGMSALLPFVFYEQAYVHLQPCGTLQASSARKAVTGKVTEGVPVWFGRGEWEGKGSPHRTESQGERIPFLPSPWAAAHLSVPAPRCPWRQE